MFELWTDGFLCEKNNSSSKVLGTCPHFSLLWNFLTPFWFSTTCSLLVGWDSVWFQMNSSGCVWGKSSSSICTDAWWWWCNRITLTVSCCYKDVRIVCGLLLQVHVSVPMRNHLLTTFTNFRLLRSLKINVDSFVNLHVDKMLVGWWSQSIAFVIQLINQLVYIKKKMRYNFFWSDLLSCCWMTLFCALLW